MIRPPHNGSIRVMTDRESVNLCGPLPGQSRMGALG